MHDPLNVSPERKYKGPLPLLIEDIERHEGSRWIGDPTSRSDRAPVDDAGDDHRHDCGDEHRYEYKQRFTAGSEPA